MIAAFLSVCATLMVLDRWFHTRATRRVAVVPIPVTQRKRR